ncbi:hypothetical protein JYU34_015088 [Plutella xylostella]|uniref:Uncharacterized protein n=1 Tax=Plutella xylostella TaxID=51655 RepID=A0ABQ7Q6I5_PLUXY|nr:hypothetical protein JYU34_015088 [Plutella xylostella]
MASSHVLAEHSNFAKQQSAVQPSCSEVPTEYKSVVKTEASRAPRSVSLSSSSSSLVRRKHLELAAAEAKAKIQMELIDKKLAYDLAIDMEVEQNDNVSRHSRKSIILQHDDQVIVNEWMERSNVQPTPFPAMAATATDAAATEAARAPQHPQVRAPAPGTPADSIIQLAHTLKDMMVTSSTHQEERLLTRLSTPRELLTFSGDCMQWLHFKSA